MHRKRILDPGSAYLQAAPMQYVNREGILEESGRYISQWGNRPLISGGKKALGAAEKQLTASLEKAGISWKKHLFSGECCEENISLIKSKVKNCKANIVIGVGGGKSLDAAKAAAEECKMPIVCVPTIAATCAATTALSVIYDSGGIFERAFYLSTNPQLVLVDPMVIANAPAIYLEAGIFDSLAKWYEGNTDFKGIQNPDIPTLAAIQLADMLNKQMEQEAVRAADLVKERRVEDPLRHVIDLIVYLSGVIQSLGQAALGGGVAHAIHNGLTTVKESHSLLHGTKVGYGIVVQLVLEKVARERIKKVVSFFRKLDLEPTLKGLNLPSSRDIIERIVNKAEGDPYIWKMPFRVTAEMMLLAIEELEENIDEL